ncbi:hypothetical protein PAMC26510_26040 [Caballeronia sordidicola]|uniref:Uncharacterized protein n=1 Tax=Caballeronia sordidicola TaxID=196367 RepID=A0A242MGC6_CABSO|nr:hypothetical protein PAMC26510_26040 [Caballeronia sordidicola]
MRHAAAQGERRHSGGNGQGKSGSKAWRFHSVEPFLSMIDAPPGRALEPRCYPLGRFLVKKAPGKRRKPLGKPRLPRDNGTRRG